MVKMTLTRPFRVFGLMLGLLAAPAAWPSEPGDVGFSERISADPRTGIAIDGFDPVAYFVDGAARAGKAEFETWWQGAVWRFVNAANRDAFVADPVLFAPAFGGHDAEAVARGAVAAADPRLFLIVADRLYLFRTDEARQRFQDADIRRSAIAAWAAAEPRLLR